MTTMTKNSEQRRTCFTNGKGITTADHGNDGAWRVAQAIPLAFRSPSPGAAGGRGFALGTVDEFLKVLDANTKVVHDGHTPSEEMSIRG
jgi:hypothetical protein